MGIKSVFSFYFKSNLLYRILFALVLGSALGMLIDKNDDFINFLTPFGDLFIRLLKMIMVPIIMFSLIVGTSSISPSHLGKVGVKAIVFYTITSLIAILIGLGCGLLFNPGSGLELSSTAATVAKSANAPTLSQIFLNIIPTNPFESAAKGDILPIICFCIFFGLGLAFCKDSEDERIKHSANVVYSFFEGASEIVFKIVKWVMQYAPIGVFALMFVVFNKTGLDAFTSLANVTITLYVGLALQVLIAYCGSCLLAGLNPMTFLKKVRPPMVTAFVTRSSNGTLPISMQTAEKDMGIPRSIYGFVLPVGATVNMDGTTVYLGVCSIFMANACGVELTMGNYVTIVATTMLAAVGTAGVPGAGALMLMLVLESIGLKIEGVVAVAYGMIFAMDAVLDMGRTSMNVVGDMMASVWVAKTEKEMDMEVWNS